MKDVWLVVPPVNPELVMPELGVPQLFSTLRAAGFEVVQTDLNREFMDSVQAWLNESPEEVRRRASRLLAPPDLRLLPFLDHLREPNPLLERFFSTRFLPKFAQNPARVLGLSIIGTPQLYPALILARMVKHAFPSTVVLAGGPYVTTARGLLPSLLEGLPFLDGFIPFSGETPMLELARGLQGRGGLADVPNLIWRDGSRIIENPLGAGLPLRDIPTPDFRGLPLDRYPARLLPLATRIGCYWGRCLFCHHHLDTPETTERPPEQAVLQLAHLKRRFRFDHFFLGDNSTSPRVMEGMAHTLIHRRAGLVWSAMARAEADFYEQSAVELHRSGLRYLFMGLESPDDEILRRVNKGITVDQVERSLLALHRAGVKVNLFVIDLPGFLRSDLDRTFDWLFERREVLHNFIMQRFLLSRSSALFEEPERLGLTLADACRDHLDVFNLPLSGARTSLPDPEFRERLATFRRDFFAAKGTADPGDAWSACGTA